MDLLKKNREFKWNIDVEAAFQELKERFLGTPILRHYNPTLPI